MAVLLLAHGDAEAKTKLRKAIESRYGLRPIALDSLVMTLKGRTRAKVGPVQAWVPFEAKVSLRFPCMMRWESTLKPLGLPAQNTLEMFHQKAYYAKRGGKTQRYHNHDEIALLRQRLWAVAAGLLTPLSDMAVKVIDQPNHCFVALNTSNQDSVRVCLRPDYTVESVETQSINPDNGTKQSYRILLSPNIIEVGDLFVPARMQIYWDDTHTMDIEPTAIESNIELPESLFVENTQAFA